MKIAVATDDLKTITSHVGRCKAFIIFDVENDKITNKEIRENNFTHHKAQEHSSQENHNTNEKGHIHEHEHNHEHEHGHEHNHSHQSLIDAIKDCSHLICSGVGRRAVEDLEQNGIKVIITNEQFAEDAAIKLSKGILSSDPSLACKH